MAKFKNLTTDAILETDNEDVIAAFESRPDLYEALDVSKADAEAKAKEEAEAKAKADAEAKGK